MIGDDALTRLRKVTHAGVPEDPQTLTTLETPKGDDAAAVDKGGYRPQVQETLVLAPFSAQHMILLHGRNAGDVGQHEVVLDSGTLSSHGKEMILWRGGWGRSGV